MNGRREFNVWFDPEAVRIMMSTLEEDHYYTKRRLDKDKSMEANPGESVEGRHTAYALSEQVLPAQRDVR
jgi:hypothetical protein